MPGVNACKSQKLPQKILKPSSVQLMSPPEMYMEASRALSKVDMGIICSYSEALLRIHVFFGCTGRLVRNALKSPRLTP